MTSASARRARIAQRAEAHVAAGAFSGIEWRVERRGGVVSEGRAGMADATAGKAMPEVPIYRIYSMTKPLVAAVAMMLVEEGRLRLADPVAAYLPEFGQMEVVEPDGKRRPARGLITIAQLLSHRSGLSYGFLPDCPAGALYRSSGLLSRSDSLADFVAGLATMPLAYDPGTGWRYSVGIDVVARVIELIEDRPFNAVLAARVFAPLGLRDTGFFVPEAERHRLMPMFGQSDIDRIMEAPEGPQTLRPADASASSPADDADFARGGHGLFSTLPDYMALARFLADGCAGGERLISRKGVEALWLNRVPRHHLPLSIGPVPMGGYGFGLAGRVMLDPGACDGLSSVGECGWAGAASTYFWIDPVEEMIGVVMTQYLGSVIPLGEDMRNAVYQALD